MTVREGRRGGWVWQTHEHLEYLRDSWNASAKDVPATAVGLVVYLAICELASRAHARMAIGENSDPFENTREAIAEAACVSLKSVDRATAELVRISLLEFEAGGGRGHGGVYTVIDPPKINGDSETPFDVKGDSQSVKGDSQTRVTNTHRRKKKKESKKESPELSQEQLRSDFADWLSHFHETTGRTTVRGSKEAKVLFARARRSTPPFSVEDLKLATVGVHSDDWSRDKDFDVPETILRTKALTRHMEMGRKAAAATSSSSGSDYDDLVENR